MVDVGGHRLYIECTGTGSPVVVLQSGLGESSSSWERIAPTVAASTTVCTYDRAGHGRSDAAAGPQDGIALATDLHTLLERAGVPGPYVLVGHSSGGPYVRVFAARYPDEIAGMVLLDAQPADAFTALPDYPASTIRSEPSMRFRSRWPASASWGPSSDCRPTSRPRRRPAAHATRSSRLPSALQQAQALTSLGDRPLVVVTAGSDSRPAGSRRRTGCPACPRTAATASPGRHPHLDHHRRRRRGSGQAILDVVSSLRAGTAVR